MQTAHVATKSRSLKTPLQLWIADNRKVLGLTPRDLAQLTGVTVDTARGWESRGRPSEDALAILERKFGQPAPGATLPVGDQTELVAALNRMAESNEKLIDMIGRVFLTLDERAESRTSFVRDALVELRTAVDRASKETGRGGRGLQKEAATGSRQTRGSEVSRGPGE